VSITTKIEAIAAVLDAPSVLTSTTPFVTRELEPVGEDEYACPAADPENGIDIDEPITEIPLILASTVVFAKVIGPCKTTCIERTAPDTGVSRYTDSAVDKSTKLLDNTIRLDARFIASKLDQDPEPDPSATYTVPVPADAQPFGSWSWAPVKFRCSMAIHKYPKVRARPIKL
jgi:hypothetical protein